MSEELRISPAELLTRAAGRQHHPTPPGATNTGSAPLSQLRLDPQNVRKVIAQASLEELAASIREHGVLEPLLVRPDPENLGGYLIISGERRFRAAQLAATTEVPIVVRDGAKVRTVQLVENIQREDLGPLEIADGIAEAMAEEQLDEKGIATRLGWKDRKVRRYLQLHAAPAVIRGAVREGLSVEVAEEGGKTKTLTKKLDFVAALDAVRIFNHHAKDDPTEDKARASKITEKVLRRALAEAWSQHDFQRYASELGGGKGSATRRASLTPVLFEERNGRLIVNLRLVVDATVDPAFKDELATRLREMLSALAGESKATA